MVLEILSCASVIDCEPPQRYVFTVAICNQIAGHAKKPLKGQDESAFFRLTAN